MMQRSSEMPALETAPPSAMQLQASVQSESSQHAHRLHGKQRNPRNRPEVFMKAAQDSAEMPLPSASIPIASTPADERQQPLALGQDTSAAQSVEPDTQDRAHTGSMGAAPGSLQASAEAAVNSGDSYMEKAAAVESQGWIAADQPARISKSESMQNKRGLAGEAPSHVKHPRHRADSNQGPFAEQPVGLQDAGTGAGHASSAAKWGRKSQTASSAPGTAAAPKKPELLGSQHVLPSTVMLDMWQVHYRADSRPLSELCACSTCQRHSRAYIHHLLKTKEMLAQVRLPIIACCGHCNLIEQHVQTGRCLCLLPLPQSLFSAVTSDRRSQFLCRCCWRFTTRTQCANSLRGCVGQSCMASCPP